VYPEKFIGFPILSGTLIRFIPNIEFYIVPIFGIIIALLIFLITSNIFNRNTAFVCAVCTFFTAPVWVFSTSFFNNIPAVSFFVAGLYFFFKFQRDFHKKDAALMGLFWGMAIMTRYTDIFFIFIPLGLAGIFTIKRFCNKKAIAGFAIFALILIIFAYDIFAYRTTVLVPGAPSETAVTGNQIIETIKFYLLPNPKIGEITIRNIYRQFLKLFFPISALFIVGLTLFIFYERKKIKENLPFFLFALFYLTYITLYFGNGWFYGESFTDPPVTTSYLRYWIFLFIASTIFSVYAISRLNRKVVTIIFVCFFIIFNTQLVVTKGLIDSFETAHRYQKLANHIENVVEPDAVVFATLSDKVIFPERKVVVRLDGNIEKTAQEIVNLHNNNITVYVSRDRYVNAHELREALINNSLKLKLASNRLNIFKVIADD
jgi:4-amino-4-deoxy-L-arabinose transferase-like glycosyltransferase